MRVCTGAGELVEQVGGDYDATESMSPVSVEAPTQRHVTGQRVQRKHTLHTHAGHPYTNHTAPHEMRYNTRSYFNVRSWYESASSTARNQLLKSGRREKLKSKKRICSEVSANSRENPWSQSWGRKGRPRAPVTTSRWSGHSLTHWHSAQHNQHLLYYASIHPPSSSYADNSFQWSTKKASMPKNQGPDLQNSLRQSYDYLRIMPKLRSTCDRRLIYKTSYKERKNFPM